MVWQKEDKFSYGAFTEKHKIILVFFAFLFIVLSLKLFYLQIIKGNMYRTVSEQQRMYNTHEKAPRGIIYADDGTMMVENTFTYVVWFYPFEQNDMPSDETIDEISRILKKDIRPSLNEGLRQRRAVKLADNLTIEEMFRIQEKKLRLNGISVVKEPKRVYNYPEGNSHLTGYTGEIRSDEMEDLRLEGYKLGDYIGRGGVEQTYDRYLQGVDGGLQLEVNAKGYQTKAFKYVPTKIGNSVHLTVSPKLQKAAYEALKESSTGRGAAVVIDIRTGAVKALVSNPGFDTNRVSAEDFGRYLKDKDLPLFNRVVQALYPPGSIFKVITFAAATEALNIDPNETRYCSGTFELGDRKYKCWLKTGHGNVNLTEALAQSCNVYFYNLALRLGVKNIDEFAYRFHLEETTGIDLPNEKKGFVPTPEWKRAKTKVPWLQGDTVIFGIGQGALWVTPLQMVEMIAVVASRGIYHRPFVVDKVLTPEGREIYKHSIKTKDPVKLSEKSWNLLQNALVEAVEHGTAQRTKMKGIKIAGKTGTAQNPQGQDHAWFVSYAPADNPEIALAVIIENGGGGSGNAVPVGRKIYEAYFDVNE